MVFRRILILITSISLVGLNAQTNDFEKRLEESYNLYTNGEHITDWLDGIESLEKLGNEFSSKTLANYWASYFYTQVARALVNAKEVPKEINTKYLLDKSQGNLDLVRSRIDGSSSVKPSDIHALQYLIYSFRNGTSKDDLMKKKFSDKAEEELKKAISLNPNNPLCDVIIATNLIKKQDLESVFAGRILLINAKNKFDQSMEPKFLTTNWNEEWIKFWLAGANKGVKFLTNPKQVKS
ncbi:hypothetical protein [Flagellimonas flava]|uniref:Uncharacterized protein n=1 Tax=Flagellimonas flava TaxID=570519 RepID=A0A1M5Q6H4_9FLAO|nr:hypothetical protein [Allomuricauda flava]SHH09123.1 hypothetical protein SAMN04488116_3505 [Allomuricauda flava]